MGGTIKLTAYLRFLLSTLFHRSDADRDLDEELRSHIARHADDLERSGLSRPEAERQARIAFGSYEKSKETVREQRPLRPPPPSQKSRLHHNRHPHSGPRHWGQHRDLRVARRDPPSRPVHRKAAATRRNPDRRRPSWPRQSFSPSPCPNRNSAGTRSRGYRKSNLLKQSAANPRPRVFRPCATANTNGCNPLAKSRLPRSYGVARSFSDE